MHEAPIGWFKGIDYAPLLKQVGKFFSEFEPMTSTHGIKILNWVWYKNLRHKSISMFSFEGKICQTNAPFHINIMKF